MQKKIIKIGNVKIGGGEPVAVQTMTNTPTVNICATVSQIHEVAFAGADIVRVAVPDSESASALKEIIKSVSVPIVADIHYDYKLAVKAIEAGAHKVRVNPSNLSREGLKTVTALCLERGIPMRVGVNEGSVLGADISAKSLARLAHDSSKRMEDMGFTNIVLAVKSSSVLKTVEANRILNGLTEYPLHIGLTEAGTYDFGVIKSAVSIGSLLLDGIGDTIRVSLAGSPAREVLEARKILRASGRDKNFAEVIACPTCARCEINVLELAEIVENKTRHIRKPLKIAVMGCAVNGVGEGKSADIGISGGKENSVIFKGGEILKTVKNAFVANELIKLIEEL
ncbi:MAG: flavodoxin-dependent (E)-4-hydroxy-3-methylbut-2-enyl-diphosphate synthase [Firmicutes bacterium]|nr:flavodoxin-dependent (E)-4-hydroxy-3-methylbut-2-enyl-diphosphate synthase [Bacillota bacterium]